MSSDESNLPVFPYDTGSFNHLMNVTSARMPADDTSQRMSIQLDFSTDSTWSVLNDIPLCVTSTTSKVNPCLQEALIVLLIRYG